MSRITTLRAFTTVPFLILLALLVGACSTQSAPSKPVQMDYEMLDMLISEDWQLETAEPQNLVYTHNGLANVSLHFSSRLDEFGSPLQVAHVKSMIGKELNRQYGGVRTRISLGGNAMVDYSRDLVDDDDVSLRAREWVVAKPVGHGDIVRVLISLQSPATAETDTSISEMIEVLDKQIGDARIPRA